MKRLLVMTALLFATGCHSHSSAPRPSVIMASAPVSSAPSITTDSVPIARVHELLKQKDDEIANLKAKLRALRLKHAPSSNSTKVAYQETDDAQPQPQLEAGGSSQAGSLAKSYVERHGQEIIPSLMNNPGHVESVTVDDIKRSDSDMYPFDVYLSAVCHYDQPLDQYDTHQTTTEQVILGVNPSTGAIGYKGGS